VITCNRCGYINPADGKQCQACGAPLTSKSENELTTKMGMGTPMPPELPAWLESLRSQERPVSSQGGSPPFNAAGLIDDGSLPIWMRPVRPEDSAHSNAYDSSGTRNTSGELRPAAVPAPNTDNTPSGSGISASSLIDEQALPSWLRQQDAGTGSTSPQTNIAASSLVEQESLPAWVRALQSQQPVQAPPPLPPTPQPQVVPPQVQSPAMPGKPMPPAHGVPAHDLIDPQSLPSWMAQVDERSTNAGQSGPLGQRGFSASSMIDVNAVPTWMRESNQATSGAPQQNLPQSPLPPSGSTWQAPTSPTVPPSPVPQGSIAASSFIDMNSLPDWLRPAAEQRSAEQARPTDVPSMATGTPGYRRPTGPIPPRAENRRVPSRPRSELSPQEESEMAANVFASMLGVASTAPKFPLTPGGSQGPQGSSNTPGQVGQPGPQSGMQPPVTASAPAGPSANSMNRPNDAGGMAGMSGPLAGRQPGMMQPPQGGSPFANQGSGPMKPAPGTQLSPMMSQQAPTTNMGVSSVPPGSNMMSEQQMGRKPAKRGLFEAIRSWLFRQ
jgi:hypothetical protein